MYKGDLDVGFTAHKGRDPIKSQQDFEHDANDLSYSPAIPTIPCQPSSSTFGTQACLVTKTSRAKLLEKACGCQVF